MYIEVKRVINEVKIEDGHIILKGPKKLKMYGEEVTVNQVNYYYEWDKFTYALGIFLTCYEEYYRGLNGEVAPLPDRMNDIEKFQSNISMVLQNKEWGKKAFAHLIKATAISVDVDKKWMKRKFTKDDWIEVFAWVYIYNILGVKKNLLNVLKIVKKIQSH
jgi:hypothetical protein